VLAFGCSAQSAGEVRPVGRVRDNTVTTTALSSRSRSSIVPDEMCVSAAVGKDGQAARKVEGLVVRLDRGSSNLPGRIKGPAMAGLFSVSARASARRRSL
jgi:hypothetical protein